jgi:hypothetical protein
MSSCQSSLDTQTADSARISCKEASMFEAIFMGIVMLAVIIILLKPDESTRKK